MQQNKKETKSYFQQQIDSKTLGHLLKMWNPKLSKRVGTIRWIGENILNHDE